MRRRRVTGAGWPGITQKRSVATTCLRRLRASRYNATENTAIAPKVVANCSSVRFRNSIRRPGPQLLRNHLLGSTEEYLHVLGLADVAHALLRAASTLVSMPGAPGRKRVEMSLDAARR